MQAKVKEEYFLSSARSAGVEFVKSEWRPVPAAAEEEVSNASFLEIFEESEINATDAAKVIAEEGGIDLTMVEGSGDDGKILKPDVVKLLETD